MSHRGLRERLYVGMDTDMVYTEDSSSDDERHYSSRKPDARRTDYFGDSPMLSISYQATPYQSPSPRPPLSPMSSLSYETSPSPAPSKTSTRTSSSTEYGLLCTPKAFYPEIEPSYSCLKSTENSLVARLKTGLRFGDDQVQQIYVSKRERVMKSSACPQKEADQNILFLRNLPVADYESEGVGALTSRLARKRNPPPRPDVTGTDVIQENSKEPSGQPEVCQPEVGQAELDQAEVGQAVDPHFCAAEHTVVQMIQVKPAPGKHIGDFEDEKLKSDNQNDKSDQLELVTSRHEIDDSGNEGQNVEHPIKEVSPPGAVDGVTGTPQTLADQKADKKLLKGVRATRFLKEKLEKLRGKLKTFCCCC